MIPTTDQQPKKRLKRMILKRKRLHRSLFSEVADIGTNTKTVGMALRGIELWCVLARARCCILWSYVALSDSLIV